MWALHGSDKISQHIGGFILFLGFARSVGSEKKKHHPQMVEKNGDLGG